MKKKMISLLLLIAGMSIASFAAASSYCAPASTLGNHDGDYVARVFLTGSDSVLDNVSAADAQAPDYYIYDSGFNAPILIPGESYTITLQVGTYSVYDANVIAAWIDFNGDGVFDASERLGETAAMAPNATTTYTFTVPTTGTTAPTRLRVRERYFGVNIDPCTQYENYGEIEDYDLNGHPLPALIGGSKRRIIPVDVCPSGDYSLTQYDGLCSGMSILSPDATFAGTGDSQPLTTGTTIITGDLLTGAQVLTGSTIMTGVLTHTGASELLLSSQTPHGSCGNEEDERAYVFARLHNISTMNTCMKARMNDDLTRGEAAKMMSNFALNILGKKPNTNATCVFSDMANVSNETSGYAMTSCQLGLMGLKGDGTPAPLFNPTGLIDKAQFATMLSRLLYGEKNNSSNACRYCGHVDALKSAGIITVTNDLFNPLKRGLAMLMLMRTQ